MFSQNLWLKVPLLFAVVGHAELFEALTERRAPWWQAGLALVIGSMVIPLLGEWVAEDAATRRWRRVGWTVAASGALLHILLDAACLALPWLTSTWRAGLAGALVGALTMAALLRQYVSALRHPDATPPPPWTPTGHGWPARLYRTAAQLGGTSIMVTSIGLAFVVAALAVLIARPGARGDGGLWFGLLFFAGCALVGIWMGLERRALLEGRPTPMSFRRLRWRRTIYTVTSDGLLCVDRRAATLYPWAALASVSAGTVFNNAAVFVELVPDASPDGAGGEEPAVRRAKELRLRRFNRALYGADLVILSALTESGPGPLLARLSEAMADLDRRAALPSAEQEIARLRARR
jgi:hypothetical protein